MNGSARARVFSTATTATHRGQPDTEKFYTKKGIISGTKLTRGENYNKFIDSNSSNSKTL